MKNIFTIGMIFLMALMGCSCKSEKQPQYVIGVSQCLDDAWRRKMNSEMENELVFHPGVELRIRYANGNSELQCMQIDSFIQENIDVLIVSPNVADEVEPAVTRAFLSGIPVVVADRKVKGEDWTAFVGGDNKKVGYLIATWLKKQAAENGGRLNVMEVTGLPGSTPTVLRHQAMMEGIRYDEGIRIVAQGCGEWAMQPAQRLVDSLLVVYPNVDVIVAQNDLMARGAANALKRHNLQIPIVGVDGMTGPGGGVEAIMDGLITVSATYPSRGDIVITRALQILRGEAFPRVTELPSVLLSREEAEPIALMAEERQREVEALAMLEKKLYKANKEYSAQRMLIIVLVLFLILLVACFIGLIFFQRYYNRIRREQEENEAQLLKQREQLNQMTQRLERSQRVVPTINEEEQLFVEKLIGAIEQRLGDPDLSVESLAASMDMSRSVLFRKVKNSFGQTPVEMIRHQRLQRANKLLQSGTMTVQQVAYEVGFSSAGYFTKCYKEEFGTTPGTLLDDIQSNQ